MYIIVRAISVVAGKNEDAQKWAIESVNYLNEKYPGHDVHAYIEWFGSVGSIHWTGSYEDLAAWENIWAELSSDAAWGELLEKSLGCFVDGSARDLVVKRLV